MRDLTELEKCDMLSKQECSLLKVLREIKYGKVEIFIDSGQPVRIERIKESIKL